MSKGFDLGGLLEQAQQLQQRMSGVQQELGEKTVEGRAGGGMVVVTVNGRLEVQRVQIDPTLLADPDRDMLQDLVAAATNAGIKAAQQMMADEMGKLTGGLGLGGLGFKLPGMG